MRREVNVLTKIERRKKRQKLRGESVCRIIEMNVEVFMAFASFAALLKTDGPCCSVVKQYNARSTVTNTACKTLRTLLTACLS